MNRPIEFRAWDKWSKRMICELTPDKWCRRIPSNVDECWILMQYTGLRDAKRTEEYPDGQKAFEGDRLLIDDNLTGVIVWYEKDARFMIKLTTGDDKFIGMWAVKDSVIIGHIYEEV